ncbi:E3 ubiquitin-protein ligase RNFT1-like [Aphidius gifuensis]|uniref:E3 ubiquitin-protein ligase RNFT1-like n=1 Tax=Aphidius gifuensis TaxID=684658 RepID=UPI001CDCF66E|nr:E3 ubiquitin-protein ligase RNFT1-like [Aphidius gifuensis]
MREYGRRGIQQAEQPEQIEQQQQPIENEELILEDLPIFSVNHEDRILHDNPNAPAMVGDMGLPYDSNEGDVCYICTSEESQPDRILPCEHVFCLGFIQRWSLRTRTCPMCRRQF